MATLVKTWGLDPAGIPVGEMKGVSVAFWEAIPPSASELGEHGDEKAGPLIHPDVSFFLPWTPFATSPLTDRVRRNHLGLVWRSIT